MPAIPAVWRIDVEPDEHQPEVRQKPWEGFVRIATLVEELRERLANRSGHDRSDAAGQGRREKEARHASGLLDGQTRHRRVAARL